MTLNNARKLHEAEWNRLFDLVQERNKLLRQLGTMAQYAGDFTPATALFMEFDFDQARDILAKVQEITPTIYAAIEEVNGYAELIGKPVIRRKKSPL